MSGPFEDLGDEHVLTYQCPACDTFHDRADYQEVRTEKRNDRVAKIYRCPQGHEVELDMTFDLPDNPSDPVYVELDPKDA